MADDVLYAGVRGVTDLMVQPGMINLDFSDIKTVMSEMGKAMMGTGEASGEGRAVAAAEAAIANPLIDDVSLKGAKGLIINITGGKDITLYEVDEAANRIKQEVDEEANIIYGTTCDDRLDGLVRVSIVATGIDSNVGINAKPLESFATIDINNDVYKLDQIHKEKIDSTSLENEQNYQIKDDQVDFENDKENHSIEDNIENDQAEHFDENIDNEKEEIVSNNSTIEMSDILEKQNNEDVADDNKDYNLSNNQENEISDINLTSDNNEDSSEEKIDERNESETSVRRLSLFDNISLDSTNENIYQNDKTEPVISENINESSVDEVEISKDASEKLEPEFSATDDDLEEDFNQETEEELLDIPTFLRRQAN